VKLLSLILYEQVHQVQANEEFLVLALTLAQLEISNFIREVLRKMNPKKLTSQKRCRLAIASGKPSIALALNALSAVASYSL